jgi:phage-related protein
MFEIVFFNEKVKREIQIFPAGIRKRTYLLLQRMKEHGPFLGMPHSKALGGGLFEIRAKGSEGIGRVFYCVLVMNRIVLLHSFVKKTQKPPRQDLEKAMTRMKEVCDAKNN